MAREVNYTEILKETINLSQLFDSYEFILLKNNSPKNKSLFGSVTKMAAYKNRLIIFDEEISNGIFVFDTTGNFIFSTNKGGGPKEVREIEDFCIDDDDNSLLVLDNGNKAIKSFSLANGEFLQSVPLENPYQGIEYVGKRKVILKNGAYMAQLTHKAAWLVYLDLKRPRKVEPVPIYVEESERYLEYGSGYTTLMKTDSVLYYSQPYGKKIYVLSRANGDVLRKVTLNFGDADFQNYADDIKNLDDFSKYSERSASIFGMFDCVSDRHIIYTIRNVDQFNYLLIDRNLGEINAYRRINNDLYSLPFWAFAGYSDNGDIYTYIPVEDLVALLDKKEKLDPALKAAIRDFEVTESNPVIVRLYNKGKAGI